MALGDSFDRVAIRLWVLARVENRVGGGGFCSGCWYRGEAGLRW